MTQHLPAAPQRKPAPYPGADDIRRGEIETHVSPGTARVLVWVFCGVIFGLPLVQAVFELRNGEMPRALKLVQLITTPHLRVPAQKELHAFEENDLAGSSVFKNAVQPQVQQALTAAGGFGNTKGVVGREGWLFYQPGIDFVSGSGLLDSGRLRTKAKKVNDAGEQGWQADPRPAILQFARDCANADVRLILVPVPDKAGCQPGQLTSRLAGYEGPPLVNRDYDRLLAELRSEGVEILDPRPELVRPGDRRFLTQDTHWTPEFMEETARKLAAMIGPGAEETTDVREAQVSRVGDIVDMLKLPPDQRLYPPQTVSIHQVIDKRTGNPWQPNPDASTLLLGDSFTNIYSAPQMGWGEAAGFGAQLARHLRRDIDVIARNGSGASLTRAELAKRPDPFGGKKTIVWQFASRDLYGESWVPIPMRAKPAAASAAPKAGELVVLARLLEPPPRIPTDDVYADAVVSLRFKVERVESGEYAESELLASMEVMRNRRLLPPASFKAGQTYRLTLERKAPAAFSDWKKLDETGIFDLPELWAGKAEPQ